MQESPTGFRGSCGAKGQTGNTREWEQRGSKNILFREKNSESLAHTHLAVLLSRIMGFRCYSGAADVWVHRQRPKAWYQLNTDTPHHGFRDYRGLDVPFLTQSAVLQALTPFFRFIFPLIYSCLLCSPFLSSGTEEKDPNVCVCLLGQVNIWNDRGWRWLECWRRCLRAKWRTIRETVIRCMHVDRASVHLEQSGVICWGGLSHSESTASNSNQTPSLLTAKSNWCLHTRRKVLWPPHPVIIHAQWLAITLKPSHFGWHSCIGQLSKKLSRATVTLMNRRVLVKGDTLGED